MSIFRLASPSADSVLGGASVVDTVSVAGDRSADLFFIGGFSL